MGTRAPVVVVARSSLVPAVGVQSLLVRGLVDPEPLPVVRPVRRPSRTITCGSRQRWPLLLPLPRRLLLLPRAWLAARVPVFLPVHTSTPNLRITLIIRLVPFTLKTARLHPDSSDPRFHEAVETGARPGPGD